MKYSANLGYLRDVDRENAVVDALKGDFMRFAEPVKSRHRSTADKAAQVRDMLHTEPGLSYREIARRAGVSPQTVGNWRRRLAQRPA